LAWVHECSKEPQESVLFMIGIGTTSNHFHRNWKNKNRHHGPQTTKSRNSTPSFRFGGRTKQQGNPVLDAPPYAVYGSNIGTYHCAMLVRGPNPVGLRTVIPAIQIGLADEFLHCLQPIRPAGRFGTINCCNQSNLSHLLFGSAGLVPKSMLWMWFGR